MELQELQPNDNPTALRIIDAAAHLFLQRGYTAVSITDIIRAAEVTKPTMYYYFADKEELFLHTGLRVLAQMGAELRAALETSGSIERRLRVVAATLMRDRNRDMRLMRHEMWEYLASDRRQLLARAFNTHIFDPMTALMAEGLAQGELGRFPAHTLAMMFMGMSESFMEFAPRIPSGDSATPAKEAAPFAVLNADILVELFLYGAGGSSAPPTTTH